MTTSAARIEANQKNALLSTGPKTLEGKARSRANALKHGFSAVELRTTHDEQAVSELTDLPWMVQEVAVLIDRLDRLHEIEDRERDRVQIRAVTCWDLDRKGEVETLALHLPKRPSEVAAQLKKSLQGCEWMVDRWSRLGRLAQSEKGWDDSARALAFGLLGIPHDLRDGNPGETFGPEGQTLDDAALALAQVKTLTELARKLTPLDDFDRETAAEGLRPADTPTDRRLRSYEQALHRRLKDYLRQLDLEQPVAQPEPSPAPTIEAKLEAPPVNEPNLEPEAPPANEPKPWPMPPLPPWVRDFFEPVGRPDLRIQKAEKRRAAADRKRTRRLSASLS